MLFQNTKQWSLGDENTYQWSLGDENTLNIIAIFIPTIYASKKTDFCFLFSLGIFSVVQQIQVLIFNIYINTNSAFTLESLKCSNFCSQLLVLIVQYQQLELINDFMHFECFFSEIIGILPATDKILLLQVAMHHSFLWLPETPLPLTLRKLFQVQHTIMFLKNR